NPKTMRKVKLMARGEDAKHSGKTFMQSEDQKERYSDRCLNQSSKFLLDIS
ncbi:unnamed protein product, partial [marine sediment metagenome]